MIEVRLNNKIVTFETEVDLLIAIKNAEKHVAECKAADFNWLDKLFGCHTDNEKVIAKTEFNIECAKSEVRKRSMNNLADARDVEKLQKRVAKLEELVKELTLLLL